MKEQDNRRVKERGRERGERSWLTFSESMGEQSFTANLLTLHAIKE